MKKSVMLMMLLPIQAAFALTGLSVCTYDKKTVNSVICYGPAVMNTTIVQGDVKVTGTLKAKNISAKNLLIEGSVEISDAKIMGSARILGSLSADNVEFQQGVAVESDSIVLNHTVVNGLMTVTSTQQSPTLQLQCSSVITGSVLFVGKPGVVQITGDSLLKGKVINGAMQFVKKSCSTYTTKK